MESYVERYWRERREAEEEARKKAERKERNARRKAERQQRQSTPEEKGS